MYLEKVIFITMDKLDTASCISDCPSSNLSSLSSLAQFDEEFCSLNSVSRDSSGILQDLPSINDDHLKSSDFKNTSTLYNLQNQLELVNYEKLRKYNLELEMQLAHANTRISELVKNGINDKSFKLYSEINQLRGEVDGLELLNNNLKLNLEESKIDLDTKTKSVTGLKAKIVDLHIEMQVLTQNNIKLNNDLCILRNDLMSSKKSELWYKDQLHECRKQKSHLIEEVSNLHCLLISKERELNVRNNEFLYNNNNFLQEIQMTHKHEFISKTAEVQSDPVIDIQAYETIIDNLNIELADLKCVVDSQRESFAIINMQNSELFANNATLTKTINDKDIVITNLTNDKKDLLMNVDVLNGKLSDLNHLMLGLVNDKSQYEIALKEAKREKADIEDAVKDIRDNFSKFAERFRDIQNELIKSNRYVKELEETRRKLEMSTEKLSAESQNYEGELVSIKITLEKEVEKSNSLNLELQLWAEYKVECEKVKKNLEYRNRKIKQLLRAKLVNIKNRLTQIENRCNRIQNQTVSDSKEISTLKMLIYESNSKSNDETIKNLKAFCKAKELEAMEKQKYYEINYRTLLKKVKEYSKSRKVFEKRCQYLQELHNHHIDELSSLKSQNNIQASDLQNLHTECDNLKNDNLRTKLDLAKLQQEYSLLEKQIGEYQDQIRHHTVLHNKQSNNNDMLEGKNKNLVLKLNETINELEIVQQKLQNETKRKQEIYESWLHEQQRNVEISAILEETKIIIQQSQAEKDSLKDEVENLTMKITCNMNELTELREQKIFLDTKRKLEELIINNLKSDIQLLTNDLSTVKSDKYFLQRLCNDLKFALTTLKNQMEVLKKHASTLSHESCVSIQEIPSPTKCDDEFINELLKRSLTPTNEKSLYQLHNNLNLLKKEMITLRKQVVNSNL